MNFYYATEIEKLNACPPKKYKKITLECFRWVFGDITDKRNFLAQADKNPKRLNDLSDLEKCEHFALSFHDSKDNSINHYNFLRKKIRNAHLTLGTHIAKGRLIETDGVGGEIENNGHFNFHHIREHSFETKFFIAEEL